MAGLQTFPQTPYHDDYSEAKDYLRVLFKPGVGVQVRELNQVQTILTNQVGRFADRFLENGARVVRGETSVNTSVPYLRFNTDPNLQKNDVLSHSTSGVTAVVVHVETVAGIKYNYIQYTKSGTQATFSTPFTLSITRNGVSLGTAVTSAIGIGSLLTVDEGIYYISGQFVKTPNTSIVLSATTDISQTPTDISVGWLITHTINSTTQDSSLFDNASGQPNFGAPGADRYKIDVTLALKPSDANISRYVEINRVIEGNVATKVLSGDYTEFDRLLADRTFEESGDYIIEDFTLTISEHLRTETTPGVYSGAEGGDAAKLAYTVDPGRAYVKGYPVETFRNTHLSVDKARTTQTNVDGVLTLPYEAYILATPTGTAAACAVGQKVTIFASAVEIGSAFVRSMTVDPADPSRVKIDVSAFQITGTGVPTNIQITGGFTGIFVDSYVNGRNASAIFKTPEPFVRTVLDASYGYYFSQQVVNSGNTVTVTSTDALSGNANDYTLVFLNAGTVIAVKPSSISALTNSVTLTYATGIPAASNVTVFGKATRTFSAVRTKTKTTVTNQLVPVSNNRLLLPNTDVIRVTSVRQGSTTGPIVDNLFTFDGGQRDTYYDFGRLTPKTGTITGNYYVSYEYYAHGAGDFFASQSYGADYGSIPNYTTSSGETIFLGSAIDFRISRTQTSSEFTSGMASMFEVGTTMVIDFENYLPRIDTVVIDSIGNLSVVNGVPATNPLAPKTPDNTLSLYNIRVNPYTFGKGDTVATKFSSRRYTMRDIGLLERRIENLEYYTSLNQIEQDIINKDVANTFRAGFVADNFTTQAVADENDPSLNCGFYLSQKELRPQGPTKYIPLVQSASASVVSKNDVYMLNYTQVAAVVQSLASDIERIQPYISFNWEGSIVLSPAGDSWINNEYLPDFVFDAGTLNVTTGVLSASGSAIDTMWDRINPKVGDSISSSNSGWIDGNTTFTTTTTTTAMGTETRQTNDVLVSVGAVAYMRGRTITVSGSGFKPNTRLYVSFDGVAVDSFCVNSGGGLVTTTGTGDVNFTFSLPGTGNIVFKTGSRVLYVSDQPTGSNNAPSTFGNAVYTAEGLINYRQRQFETTRLISQRTSTVTQNFFTNGDTGGSDPIAQSFRVPFAEGMYITSVDIFFGPGANEFPATVEVRNMINGYPGPEVAARKTLPATSLNPSSNGSVATRFEFDYPVFLKGATEYAFVVKTDSQTLTIWTSVLGNRAYLSTDSGTPTGEIITKQPFLGSMFRSQNDSTWTAEQTRDVKFTINRAEFVTNGSVTLRNGMPSYESTVNTYREKLTNPFTFVSGSATVLVRHPNHGFRNGDTVTFTRDGTTPTSYAGVPTTAIFGVARAVSAVTVDTYTVTFTGNNATSSTVTGGVVYATSRAAFVSSILDVASVIVKGTNIGFTQSVRDYTSGTQSPATPVVPNTLVEYDSLKVSGSSSDASVEVVATFSTTSSKISPVLDLQKVGMVAINHRIDASGTCQYIQKPVDLVNPANRVNIYVNANVPNEASIQVYYRTGQDSLTGEWKLIQTPIVGKKTSSKTTFSDWEYQATETNDFYKLQVKVVLNTTNPAKAPRLKNVRSIAVKAF